MTHKLASIDDDSWELESAEARHAESPETFWIPPASERDQLKPGQGAKLLFLIDVEDDAGNVDRCCERMWVYVTERVGQFYTGRLQNQPECTDSMRPGMQVVFLAEHVADVSDIPADYEPQ
jgi:hypothetical protein